jgi:hypothetical protein
MEDKLFQTIFINSRVKFISLLMIVVSLFSCENIYKESVRDYEPYSYFVSVAVTSGDDTIKIVVENVDLYTRLITNEESLSENKYEKDLYKAIVNGTPLKIDDISFAELKPYELIKDEEISKLYEKGLQTLINAFFINDVQYKALTVRTKSYLINCLYANKILVKTDCESGFLYLRR